MENDTKFAKKEEAFTGDYAEKATLQKSLSEETIEELVQSILQRFPRKKGRSLRILDLCCGDGESTYKLLKQLDYNKIEVEQIDGYDISQEQIDRAEVYSQEDPRLHFYLQNVEEMTDHIKYDLVISLFGLHWMENLPDVAKRIYRSLKPTGELLFFVPIDRGDLSGLRENLMQSEEWSVIFRGYKLRRFIGNEQVYIRTFGKHFDHNEKTAARDDQRVDPEEKFAESLSSWLQEIRHMKQARNVSDVQCQQYVKELVQTIPTDKTRSPYLYRIRKENGFYVNSSGRYLLYQGPRKEHQILKDVYLSIAIGIVAASVLYANRDEMSSKLNLIATVLLAFAIYLVINKAERNTEQFFNAMVQLFEQRANNDKNANNNTIVHDKARNHLPCIIL